MSNIYDGASFENMIYAQTPWNIFAEKLIIDHWQGPKYLSEISAL